MSSSSSSLWPLEPTGEFCVKAFLDSPLVFWAKNLATRDGQALCQTDLFNGDFLKDVLREIEPQLLGKEVKWLDDPVLQRLTVLEGIIVGLRAYFTDVLGQIMVMRPPDILFMSLFPSADHAAKEMRKLFLLLLSFAVQSGQKERIIERIQNMDEEAQKGIVECIKEVTDNPLRVWKVELLELSDNTPDSEHDRGLLVIAQQHIRNLVDDRDALMKLVLILWRENHQLKASSSGELGKKFPLDPNHHAAEATELRSQIRRLSQELYDCEEDLKECKDELNQANGNLGALQKEHATLTNDARLMKMYKDELDIHYEKEKKSEKLESELARYRNQLVEMEYYKSRVEEMQQNWQLLTETKVLLESHLDFARKRAELIPQLENEISQLRFDLKERASECARSKEQVEVLLVENAQLVLDMQRFRSETGHLSEELSRSREGESAGITLCLSDQLNESLSTKVLRLEMENEKLKSLLQSTENISVQRLHSVEHTIQISSPRQEVFRTKSNSRTDSGCSAATDCESAIHHDVPSAFMAAVPFASGATFLSLVPGETTSSEEILDEHSLSSHESDKYLEEDNAHLNSEIAFLRKTVDRYQKLETKLEESRNKEIQSRQALDDAYEKIYNLEADIVGLTNQVATLSTKTGEIEALKKKTDSLEIDLSCSAQKLTCSERENKRLRQQIENVASQASALQKRVDELEAASRISSLENSKIPEMRSRIMGLESINTEVKQRLAACSNSMETLQKELLEERLQSHCKGKVLKDIAHFLRNRQVELPEDTDYDHVDTASAVVETLSEAIAQCEKNALQRSHQEILSELESLKGQYEVLRKSQGEQTTESSGDSRMSPSNKLLDNVRTETVSLQKNLSETKAALQSAHIQIGSVTSVSEKLQTENQRLESRSAQMEIELKLLTATNASLLKSLVEQEKAKEILLRDTEESHEARNTIMTDHEALQRFHEELSTDHAELRRELNRLRTEHRSMNRELELTRQKLQEQDPVRLRRDSENVRAERLQRLETEYEKLAAENDVLRTSNRQLGNTYRVLTEEHKTVKTEINQLKLKKIEYEGVVYDCKSQIQSRDIESNRHTEILLGIIASLEDEKRSFAAAIERLVLQYDDVFLHSWREKNQMQSEHKELREKLHALDLQKQLLIQKLYDTFKTTDVRKRNMSLLKRFRRAAGELVGRSRSRSRTRTISPTDSTADSSSVESSHGGKPRNSESMHSLSALRNRVDQNRTKNGPQLSYSSDDLHKNSSSASSSCISPSEQPDNKNLPAGSQTPQSRQNVPVDRDPAFHRVGSRRGVYEPAGHPPVVVHHPIVKEPRDVQPHTMNSPLPKSHSGKSGSESDSSKPGSKKCCSSSPYGGFHDCTMLSYTRLTATTPLLNGSTASSLRNNEKERIVGGDRMSSNSTLGSAGSSISTPDGSVKSSYYAVPQSQRNSQSAGTIRNPEKQRTSVDLEVQQNGYIFRPKSSVYGVSSATLTSDGINGGDSDIASTWSFPSSEHSAYTTLDSTTPTNYFKSDGQFSRSASVADKTMGSLNGSGEENGVWFEYGCV